MMHKLEQKVTSPGYVGTQLAHKNKGYVVKLADNFHYEDPVDGSIAVKQVCSEVLGTVHQPLEVCTKNLEETFQFKNIIFIVLPTKL
jgi:hypothetical protein